MVAPNERMMFLYCWRLRYFILLLVVVLVQEVEFGFFTVIFYRFNETPGRAEENGGIA